MKALEKQPSPQHVHDSASQLRHVIDLATEYYWEQDLNQRFTYVLFAHHRSTIDAAEHFLGKTFWELDDATVTSMPLWNLYRQNFEAREPIRGFVVTHRNREGGSYYQSISGVPRYDDEGDCIGYCGVVRDVSAEKQNESNADSLELAAIGIAHVGIGGRIVHANRKLCDMLGYTLEELHSLSV